MLLRFRKFFGTVLAWIDRLTSAVRALGMEAFLWPVAIGLGLGISVLELAVPAFSGAVLKRHAVMQTSSSGFFAGACGTAAVVVLSLGFAVLRRRFRRDPRPLAEIYRSQLRSSAFIAGLPFALALKERFEAFRGTLAFAFAFTAAVTVAYSVYHAAASAAPAGAGSDSKRAKILAGIALGTLMTGYAVAVAYLSIANHLSFNTGRADLGFYISVFRQSSQGKLLGCSLCGGTHLTGHFDPILVPLSPLYLIYPFAETPLVIQAVWLASGALPVYLVARHHTRHRGVALSLAAAYLLYPALHGVNLFDFHSVALCIPLFVWLLYFLEERRLVGYYVTLLLLLLVREDISVALVCVGIYCVFGREKDAVRVGWITIVAAIAYFLIAKLAFMGRLDPLNTVAAAAGPDGTVSKGGYAYYYEELIPPGHSTSALLQTIVGDPIFTLSKVLTDEKLDYVAQLAVPLLGLPFLGRGKILLAYGAALTLLATRPYVYSVHFQYSSLLVPFAFLLTASALGRIRSGELVLGKLDAYRLTNALGAGILVASVLCSWKFGGLVENDTFRAGFRPLSRLPTPGQVVTDKWLKHLSLSFPRGARVAANSRILTHLGSVSNLYLVDDPVDVDYVVAGMNNRGVAKLVSAEVARHELVQIDKHDLINVYRATHLSRPALHSGKAPPKPIEDD